MTVRAPTLADRLRRFLRRWTLPLVGGPALTVLGLAALWATADPDAGPLPAFVADASADGALVAAATLNGMTPPDGPPPTVDETVAAVRDVTPPGVTPGPVVAGPLRRVKPAVRVTARASEQPADRYARVVVLDAGHFRAVRGSQAVVVSIAGITVPAFDETCTDANGIVWKCGARARADLARLVGGRSVGCTTVDDSDTRNPVARCSVGNRDLAAWLVEQGWAEPDGSRVDLVPTASAAKAAGKGRHGEAPLGVIAG